MPTRVELIAPAGNWDCARAAVANGANAVYFGSPRFNARMRADNFSESDLPALVTFLHEHGVRAYCAFNTLIFTDELESAEQQLLWLDDAGVDAVMVQDLGIAELARSLGLRLQVHASTQMTISSPEGAAFAARLGITRVVLARETSLRELAGFVRAEGLEWEVFVHGALCISYSGQCLTSEALGQRSANRGECAQACRLPYELIVDGQRRELGERRYLLSPQDLCAVDEIPELLRLGVTGFKIEGRLKSPEYVAASCQVYRRALDAGAITAADRYSLEMTFSRGLYPGWLHGVNHQELVHGKFGTKRGPLVGVIRHVGGDHVTLDTQCALQPGDGVAFDTGGNPDGEQGGRIWEIRDGSLYFERGHIDFTRLHPGDRVWKTSDPQLMRRLRRSFAGDIPHPKQPLSMAVYGSAGKHMVIECCDVRVISRMPLQTAFKRPLNEKLLREHLGRLGETDFVLAELNNQLVGPVILPVSELNRLRRELAAAIEAIPKRTPVKPSPGPHTPQLTRMLTSIRGQIAAQPAKDIELVVLCRTEEQLRLALQIGSRIVYLDDENLRFCSEAVALARQAQATIFLATPRIQKSGERGLFQKILSARPDGVLIRNLGGLEFFREHSFRMIGDHSLNVANPLSAELLRRAGLEHVTASYDCNADQARDLLHASPPSWWEVVIHHHLPMFHMEHCLFAAFLSTGADHIQCGRPCDRHLVRLRDRTGVEHPVHADVGCRNTVYHARAQSGAEFLAQFIAAGARRFRVELLDENADQSRVILRAYRELLDGNTADANALFRRLNVVRQLGVTSGTLTVLG